MSELISMADQFGGLPMDQLIGGPLNAACDAQVALATATSDFIENVGFVKDKDGNSAVRMVDFSFQKPEKIDDVDGKAKFENVTYNISVPFISIVSVPTLQVTSVDINFMMEVKSSFSENSKEAKEGKMDATVSAKYGPFSVKVRMQGSVSSSKETQRQSDNSAKYDVSVKAAQQGTPEGLSKVLDIMQQCIVPVKKGSTDSGG